MKQKVCIRGLEAQVHRSDTAAQQEHKHAVVEREAEVQAWDDSDVT